MKSKPSFFLNGFIAFILRYNAHEIYRRPFLLVCRCIVALCGYQLKFHRRYVVKSIMDGLPIALLWFALLICLSLSLLKKAAGVMHAHKMRGRFTVKPAPAMFFLIQSGLILCFAYLYRISTCAVCQVFLLRVILSCLVASFAMRPHTASSGEPAVAAMVQSHQHSLCELLYFIETA